MACKYSSVGCFCWPQLAGSGTYSRGWCAEIRDLWIPSVSNNLGTVATPGSRIALFCLDTGSCRQGNFGIDGTDYARACNLCCCWFAVESAECSRGSDQ